MALQSLRLGAVGVGWTTVGEGATSRFWTVRRSGAAGAGSSPPSPPRPKATTVASTKAVAGTASRIVQRGRPCRISGRFLTASLPLVDSGDAFRGHDLTVRVLTRLTVELP